MTTHTTAGGIEFVRTPDDRFADLFDFPYEPRYLDVDGLRMAYVDTGPEDGPPILLLHGEPTWSYLYRRMIPPLVEAGYRCIAPDLIGFGRSDKPTSRAVYTYAGHVAWMRSFLDQLGLSFRSVFAQDWGGLIGLHLVVGDPDRFDTVVIGNTGLPVGQRLGEGFDFWLQLSQTMDPFDTGGLLQQATQARELTDSEVEAYRAPFPDESFLAGAREFPVLVPITAAHGHVAENLAAWERLEAWTEPFLTLWCPDDQVLGPLQQEFVDRVPGAAGQPHRRFTPGGHFIQDDRGEDVAAAMIDWLATTM
ncbi:MAG: haloalkane dehalogenase [Actinomycetota bacterium]